MDFSLSKSKIFLFFCLSFFAGVLLASFVFPFGTDGRANKETISGVLFFCAAFFFALAAVFWKRKTAAVVCVCFLVAAFGFYRYLGFYFPAGIPPQIKNFNDLNSEIAVRGVVGDYPDFRSRNAKYEVSAESAKIGDKTAEVEGKILVTLANFPKYEYGDELELTGKLVSPKNFSTGENGTEFDYKSYLAKGGIYSLMNYPKAKLLGNSGGSPLYETVFRLKSGFEENLGKVLPEPHASFAAGLLLGSRGGIPDDLKEVFAKAGVSHILAISGYNISVLVWFLASLFAFFYLSPRIIFFLAALAIFVFVVLTGAEPSVIRAAIMGGLVLLARKEGRVYSVANAVVFAGAAMLYFNPLILRYDAGFQLSFLATLGLIYVLPRLEIYFKKTPEILGFKEAFLATVSAQIAVLPLILSAFGNLSFVSIFANVLILPAVPFAMFFGFLAGVSAFLFLPLAKIIGFFAWILLAYEIKIAEFFAGLPFGFLKISYFSAYLAVLYYGFLGYYLFVRSAKRLAGGQKKEGIEFPS